MGESKLELQSGKAQFGSKLGILLSHVTLKFDGWPWKIIGHLFDITSSCVHHFITICDFKLELWSGNGFKLGFDLCETVTLTFDLWPWPFTWTSLLSLVITPENFMMIWWLEHSEKGETDKRTDVPTDRRMDWTIHRAAWSQLKTIWHLFYATSSFVHHFVVIGEFKLEWQSRNTQFGSKSMGFFCLLWPWNLTNDVENQ